MDNLNTALPHLNTALPLGGFAKSWSGIEIKEFYRGELIALSIKQGQNKAFNAAFKDAYNAAPPAPNQLQTIEGGFAFWTGQDQYMLSILGENIQADKDCAAALSGTAYASLQSDGWASLALRGQKLFDVLERFIPLDLRRAPHGFATRSMAHHMAVILLKHSDTHIELLTPRSSARAFLDGLCEIIERINRQ